MSNTSRSAEVSNRCIVGLRESGVPDKVLWLVEVQPLDVFAKTFPDVANEVLPRAEDAGHDFIVYHHQENRVSELATFNSELSADLRLACWRLAERLFAKSKPGTGNNRYAVECEHCGASGVMLEGDSDEECPVCKGTGYLPSSEGLKLIDALDVLGPWWRGRREC